MLASIEIKTMKLQGTVQDGKGDASFWLRKYSDVYQLFTGMAIIPGSLNVQLTAKLDWNDASFAPFKKIYSLIPYGGNREICLIPCEIYQADHDKIYGFAWATTHAANASEYKVLEIITSVILRDVLQLKNGSVVTIEIPVPWKN